ncbi:hypothetical protein [Vibrio navarrensis]|uniref:hypothetical protein n=1 Tax=Vibrio navarrensis TaxID=29495 RepID=UPI00186A8120|nr:hypothetical protein [Vibrio navarrensis]MBE4617335.1 hypothetical protein [Vibrio navarrensis]
MKNAFYKTNGFVGSSVMFWAIDGLGYTSNIDLAEIYTREQVQRDVDNDWLRDKDEFPLCAESVNALSQWRVDCQYVKKTYPEFTDPNNEYVLVKKGLWDGNDLAFLTGSEWDFDYSKAKSFSAFDVEAYIEQDQPSFVIVPRYHTDEIARRTFQKQNINRRKMISGAGIIGLRQKKQRKTTGKTRFNCLICGKLVWEHAHPDDQVICSSASCEIEHKHKLEESRKFWQSLHSIGARL